MPLQGDLLIAIIPRALPWARSFYTLPLLYHSASDFQFPSAGDRWFMACYWTSDGIAGNGGAEGEELLNEALLLRHYAYQVVLLIDRHAGVGIGIDAYPGKEKEDGCLHLLHIEGMIAVCLGYLLLHDEGNLLQLIRGAFVPAARDGEVYLFLHILTFLDQR